MNSRSKSSGQILAVVIIVLALIGGGFWWLFTNKQAMAKEGREFGREAIQRIAVQHDLAFFSSRLGPAARMQFPPSAQQDFISRMQKLGAPAGPVERQLSCPHQLPGEGRRDQHRHFAPGWPMANRRRGIRA